MRGSYILQSKSLGGAAIGPERGDEHYVRLVFFLESNLMITRVTIKKGE
jgi:hypothetical protein